MKTYAIITIEHPDDMTAEHLLNYVVQPAINDMNNDSQPEWKLSVSNAITQDALESKSLQMALGNVLSNYPQDIEPEAVLELVEEEHENILVWEHYENESPRDVVYIINAMQWTYFNELKSLFQ
jgi:hypothetical protein